jgi:hypothetical protein
MTNELPWWPIATGIATGVGIFVVAIASLFFIPWPADKWEGARVIKVCAGLPVIERRDGETFVRYRYRHYAVDRDKLECSP